MFLDISSDDTESSCVIWLTVTKFVLTRYHIKVDPGTVLVLYHSLCTKDHAVIIRLTQGLYYVLNLFFGEFMRSFFSPACKDFVCMMVVVMIVVMASAGAVLIMFMLMVVMMLVIMVMIVMVFFVVMVMMMLMLFVLMVVASAGAVLIMFMLMVMIVMMFVIVLLVVMIVMMLMLVLFCLFLRMLLCHQFSFQRVLSLYNL